MNPVILAAIDVTLLAPIAAFLAITAFSWLMLEIFFFRKTRSEERLDKMKAGREESTRGSGAEGFTKILKDASPSLGKTLQPKSEAEQGKLREKLNFAGFRSEEAMAMFLTVKLLSAVGGILLGGGVTFLTSGLTTGAIMKTFMVGGVFFFAPELILAYIASKRKEKIFLSMPDALDLLTVCVEAGLGLDQAMRKVADEMAKSAPVLSHEFAICNMQVQMGQTREEVFKDLGRRNGVDDLKTLASVIIQTDKFGSSIAKALRVQSDAMRTQRRQIAEEKAAKTAVKLIFPLVIFIFPGIFVVLVGPAAITMINEMLPAFQK
jgi:tight adherence protein C